MDMKLTLLCENEVADKAARKCKSEWGLSFHMALPDGKAFLLDAGHTDIWWKNAVRLGVDLNRLDGIALSHYHWDHAGGLRYHRFTETKTVFAHPELPGKADEGVRSVLERDFDLRLSETPVEAAENFFFLGEIPRVTEFEKGVYKDNPMRDDTALALKTPGGCIVISGCAHAGIVNICEYAKEITGQTLRSVIGGFHLDHKEEETVGRTLDYFRNENPESLYPLHCVDFETRCAFYNAFGGVKLSAGDSIEF